MPMRSVPPRTRAVVQRHADARCVATSARRGTRRPDAGRGCSARSSRSSVRVASCRSRDEARATPSSTPCVNDRLPALGRRRSRSAARTSPRCSTTPPPSSAAPTRRRGCRPAPCGTAPTAGAQVVRCGPTDAVSASRRTSVRSRRRVRRRPSIAPAAAPAKSSRACRNSSGWTSRGVDLQRVRLLGDVGRAIAWIGMAAQPLRPRRRAASFWMVSNIRPRSRGS